LQDAGHRRSLFLRIWPADSLIGIILGLAQRNRGRKTSDLDVTLRLRRVSRTRKGVAFLLRRASSGRPDHA
jgi:hypothetical protein